MAWTCHTISAPRQVAEALCSEKDFASAAEKVPIIPTTWCGCGSKPIIQKYVLSVLTHSHINTKKQHIGGHAKKTFTCLLCSQQRLSILVSVIFDLSETHQLSSSFSMVFSLIYTHHTVVTSPYSMGRITLVGGLEHEFYFSIQLGMSSSQLTNSYFSEG